MGIGHCPRKPSLRAGWPRAILFHECFHPRRRCSSEVTACLGVCSEPCRGTPGTAGVCAFSPPSEAGPSILRACLRGLPTWTGHDLGGTRLTARRKGSQGPVWECQCRPGWGGSPGGGPSESSKVEPVGILLLGPAMPTGLSGCPGPGTRPCSMA